MSEADEIVESVIRGAWRALAARAMAELRLADAMAEPGTASELASRLEVDAPALGRLLRTLASIGLVTHRDGVFGLTAAGERLRSDVPGSDWGAIMMMAAPWTLATWQALPEAIRAGSRAFDRVHGETFWEYLRSNPEAGRYFDAAMSRRSRSGGTAALVTSLLAAERVGTLVDVGGGTGRLLAEVVAAVPGLRGVLADQETPVAGAAEVFAEHGVADRCEAVVTDFFASAPKDGDAYLLSNILHDWDDEHCRLILGRIREAAPPGALVLVAESVLPPDEGGLGPETAPLRLLDLAMLLNFGARERTLAEYTELLESSGFDDVRLLGDRANLVVARVGG